jgi:hypothetical protein
MNTENKPIYCFLAFGSASINSDGEYIPCCNIRTADYEYYTTLSRPKSLNPTFFELDPAKRINANNLKAIRKKLINGVWPDACSNCKKSEDVGINSMRTIWNRYVTDSPMVEDVNPMDIKFLDLTFSTKCNSKCMTCGAGASDFWEEEWAVLYPETKSQVYSRVSINETTASKLIRDFPNIIRVNLIGGEPTISEEHLSFLKKLVAEGKSKNIELGYVTNLTGLNAELIEIWKNFKNVGLTVSIDGYGKTNEYIRYPFKWSKTEANLRELLEICRQDDQYQFGVGLSCTLSLLNAIQAPDLLEFWYDILKEYGLLNRCGSFLNRVNNPINLMVHHLSESYRQIGIEKVNRLLAKIEKDNEDIQQSTIDCIKLIGSILSEPCSNDINEIKSAQTFIKGSDDFRKRNIKDYIPELVDELNLLSANATGNPTN